MAIPDDLFPLDATEALLNIKIGIDEDAWKILQYEFMRCVGHRYDHTYPTDDGWLVDAFNSFCKRLLTPDSEPEFLDTIILLLSYLCRLRWEGLNEHKVKSILRNPMIAKRGELGLIKADAKKSQAPSVAISHPATTIPSRATWLRDRLSERKWDKNTLEKFHGPEHRTTQKILDGKPVGVAPLRKVIKGLNQHSKFTGLKFSEIPND